MALAKKPKKRKDITSREIYCMLSACKSDPHGAADKLREGARWVLVVSGQGHEHIALETCPGRRYKLHLNEGDLWTLQGCEIDTVDLFEIATMLAKEMQA